MSQDFIASISLEAWSVASPPSSPKVMGLTLDEDAIASGAGHPTAQVCSILQMLFNMGGHLSSFWCKLKNHQVDKTDPQSSTVASFRLTVVLQHKATEYYYFRCLIAGFITVGPVAFS